MESMRAVDGVCCAYGCIRRDRPSKQSGCQCLSVIRDAVRVAFAGARVADYFGGCDRRGVCAGAAVDARMVGRVAQICMRGDHDGGYGALSSGQTICCGARRFVRIDDVVGRRVVRRFRDDGHRTISSDAQQFVAGDLGRQRARSRYFIAQVRVSCDSSAERSTICVRGALDRRRAQRRLQGLSRQREQTVLSGHARHDLGRECREAVILS